MALNPQIYVGGKYGTASIQHGGRTEDTLSYRLKELGLSVVDNLNDATHYLSLDVKESELQDLKSSQIPITSRFLIVQEPEVVLPANFAKKYLKQFGIRVLVGRDPSVSSPTLLWPQFRPKQSLSSDFPRITTGAAMIASNHLSFIKGELYSLRRICAFTIPGLDVFGRGWNHNKKMRFRIAAINLRDVIIFRKKISIQSLSFWFKEYEKSVHSPSDKFDVLNRYRVSLVIENSKEFLSEKLFDAFFAKCIPVYVGPKVENFDIPKNLVIQCDPNIVSISEGIRKAEDMDYDSWLEELNNWLNSDQTIKRWSFDSYAGEISKMLVQSSI